MDPHRLLVTQIETLRALLARTAPDVSLSFFFWSRAPGNDYVSFYPTAWLPSLDAWSRGHVGDESIFRRVMERGSGKRALTFAVSERGAWTMAWKVLSEGEPPFHLDLARSGDPDRAAAALAQALDVRWLAAHGNVDPATSAVVDRWLGDALEATARAEATWIIMAYEQTAAIADLWRLRLHGARETVDVPWPDRAAALVASSRRD